MCRVMPLLFTLFLLSLVSAKDSVADGVEDDVDLFPWDTTLPLEIPT